MTILYYLAGQITLYVVKYFSNVIKVTKTQPIVLQNGCKSIYIVFLYFSQNELLAR